MSLNCVSIIWLVLHHLPHLYQLPSSFCWFSCFSDTEKAKEAWQRYKSREKSHISELFVGQLKSTLECSTCGFKSVTFDPFWDLSLPIPRVSLYNWLAFIISFDFVGHWPFQCSQKFSVVKLPRVSVHNQLTLSDMQCGIVIYNTAVW